MGNERKDTNTRQPLPRCLVPQPRWILADEDYCWYSAAYMADLFSYRGGCGKGVRRGCSVHSRTGCRAEFRRGAPPGSTTGESQAVVAGEASIAGKLRLRLSVLFLSDTLQYAVGGIAPSIPSLQMRFPSLRVTFPPRLSGAGIARRILGTLSWESKTT